ncbi:hypothetical protein [Nostoc sp.]|uniref:hypothetical protein n=1 Tax=Nostoc sp. TaxID=1180 RepID=UPI002FF6ADBA
MIANWYQIRKLQALTNLTVAVLKVVEFTSEDVMTENEKDTSPIIYLWGSLILNFEF